MSTRLRTPWLAPVSVDPKLFVNRSRDMNAALDQLGDLVEYRRRKALILIAGDRGIGKSIFARTLLERAEKAYPKRILTVVVDLRSVGERVFLKHLAQKLADRARSVLSLPDGFDAAWLAPLTELALSDRIVRGVSSTTGREYGAGGEVSGGLWGVLQAKTSFLWKERRESGVRGETVLEVNEDVVRGAIQATLEALSELVSVVVFFDDLDQGQRMQNPENAKETIRAVLDLTPCIAVIHLRSEVAFPDVRREVDDRVTLGALDAGDLHAVLKRRLEDALPRDRERVESREGWEPFRKLMAATGNPYVLLRWLVALAGQHDAWPPPAGWTEPRALRGLALAACNGPEVLDAELESLGRILDHVGRSEGILEQELRDGHHALSIEARHGLSEGELERLKRHELLLPVDRFELRPGLRLDPLLELIRPSVAAKIRTA